MITYNDLINIFTSYFGKENEKSLEFCYKKIRISMKCIENIKFEPFNYICMHGTFNIIKKFLECHKQEKLLI